MTTRTKELLQQTSQWAPNTWAVLAAAFSAMRDLIFDDFLSSDSTAEYP